MLYIFIYLIFVFSFCEQRILALHVLNIRLHKTCNASISILYAENHLPKRWISNKTHYLGPIACFGYSFLKSEYPKHAIGFWF